MRADPERPGRDLSLPRWGLVPSWAADPSGSTASWSPTASSPAWASRARSCSAPPRASGPIGGAQRRLVHLCHAELGRLWDAAPAADTAIAELPPRLRQTLARLRAGDGEKQIAARLGLSRHTVHNYVKALYLRVDASSRGELLARTAPRLADFRPRLNRELG